MTKHKVAVYGSLRSGMYNRRGFPTLKTLETTRLEGYKMRSLGGYPYIYPSDTDSVVVELCEVEDEDYGYIRRMELGAGYDEVPVEINGDTYLIYVYRRDNDHNQLVGNGDWVDFVN